MKVFLLFLQFFTFIFYRLKIKLVLYIYFQLLNSMVDKLRNYDDDPLPQDLQEGVDDDEWVGEKYDHLKFLQKSRYTVSTLILHHSLCFHSRMTDSHQ